MTGRQHLKLSFWEKIEYYAIVLFLIAVSIITSWSWIEIHILGAYDGARSKDDYDIVMPLVFLIGVVPIYFYLRNKLKFTVVPFYGDQVALERAIKWCISELEWNIEHFDTTCIRARNSIFGYGGSLITIIVQEDKLLISSINDPRRTGSPFATRLNEKNIEEFIRATTSPIDQKPMSNSKTHDTWTLPGIIMRVLAYASALLLVLLAYFLITNSETANDTNYGLLLLGIVFVYFRFEYRVYKRRRKEKENKL